MPSLGINRPETLKKVAPSLPDTKKRRARARKKATQASELATWKRVLGKEARVTQTFTSDVIPCYRKRGAGEPIFALRKASLDILFSDVRFNRAALVSRPRASERANERTSERGATSFRPDSPRTRYSLYRSPSSRFTARFRRWTREARRDLLSIVVSLLLAVHRTAPASGSARGEPSLSLREMGSPWARCPLLLFQRDFSMTIT